VGTLLSALLLIPAVGTRRTFLVFALAIALVAVSGLRPLRRWALAPALIALLIALPVGTLKAQTDQGRVIYETETAYQYARVIQRSDGSRLLELNEGQADHSLYEPHTVLTGDYWDGMLVDPFAALRAPPRRIAILGNAAGTTARAYGHFFPRTRVDGVELDPELTKIGRRFFGLHNPRLSMHHEDARPWLERTSGRYDVIVVDAYRQPYIPFYLTTREFFGLCRDRLAPGGVVVVNVGHPEHEDQLEKVLTAGMGDAFGDVLRDPIENTNTLLVGSRAALSPGALARRARALPTGLRPTARAAAGRLAPRLGGGTVYTDDKAPVEWLIDKSIVQYAAGGD
jgi:spermidine synthase